jgi:hypothetical protein
MCNKRVHTWHLATAVISTPTLRAELLCWSLGPTCCRPPQASMVASMFMFSAPHAHRSPTKRMDPTATTGSTQSSMFASQLAAPYCCSAYLEGRAAVLVAGPCPSAASLLRQHGGQLVHAAQQHRQRLVQHSLTLQRHSRQCSRKSQT